MGLCVGVAVYAWLLWWLFGRPLAIRRERRRFLRAVIGALSAGTLADDERADRIEQHYAHFVEAIAKHKAVASPLPIMLDRALYEMDQGTDRFRRRYRVEELSDTTLARLPAVIDAVRDRRRIARNVSAAVPGGASAPPLERAELSGADAVQRLEERLDEHGEESRVVEERHRQQMMAAWAAIAVSLVVGVASVVATIVA
jgi:hypothetical protein